MDRPDPRPPVPQLDDESACFEPPVGMAQRFWAIVPERVVSPRAAPSDGPATRVVRHLVSILRELRDAEAAPSPDKTLTTLSLTTLLHQQEMLGDLSYASPEQLRGESITERSLTFSVAVLLFERLCERHPFGAVASPLRLVRIGRGQLGSGVNYFQNIPGPLRLVLRRALSASPADRPARLDQLVDELVDQLPALIASEREPERGTAPGMPTARVALPTQRSAPSPKSTVARTLGVAAVALSAGAALLLGARHRAADGNHPEGRVYRREYVALHDSPSKSARPGPAPVAPADRPYFDPTLAAAEAAGSAEACFSARERATMTFDFGLSLRFTPASPRATRVYFPAVAELGAARRACLSRALRGTSAAGAPTEERVVEYRFRASTDGVRAMVRRVPP